MPILDDAVCPQFGDRFPGVSGFQQQFLRVLPQLRRGPARSDALTCELHRCIDETYVPMGRVVDLCESFSRNCLGVLDCLRESLGGRPAAAFAVWSTCPLS